MIKLNKKNILFVGIISIILIMVLGCTSHSVNQYSYNTTQETNTTDNIITTATENIEIQKEKIDSKVSARDWYNIAKEDALLWRTDSKLIEIHGDNKPYDSYYKVDGKTDKWEYYFISIPIQTKYKVVVEKGEITQVTELEMSMSAKTLYKDVPTDNNWMIDSSAAVDTVNTKRGGFDLLSLNKNVKVNYILKLSGSKTVTPIVWTISYFPENYGQTLIENINAETGKSF